MLGNRQWVPARVAAVHDLTPAVRMIEIEPAGNPAGRYPPGSHLDIRMTIDGQDDTRSYSLVGADPVEGRFRIAVKRLPDSRGGSVFMHALQPDAELSIAGPASHFELRYGAPEYALVAGGIGITPIIGMASLLDHAGAPFRLHYAGRRRADMPFVEELRQRLGDRLELHVSEEGSRLDVAAVVKGLQPDAELYLCGPLRLQEAARAAWREQHREPTNLRFETFASSGAYPPEEFVVTVVDHGKDVTVPENRSMLEALRGAGVEVMYDCLRGECGLCTVDIVSADCQIDHRDVFLSQEERAEQQKICTCVSRVIRGSIAVDTGFRGVRHPAAASSAHGAHTALPG